MPAFGGTPAAWATVLLFFQSILLLGYLYAHLSVTRLGPRRGSLVHLGLVGLAILSLVIAPARYAELRNAAAPPGLNLLWILAVAVGPAAFVLASTTPLISAWSARARRSDPYTLYALSNAGSLVALILYPIVIEPAIGLQAQRAAWAVGFALLGLLLAASGLAARQAAATPPVTAPEPRPSGRERARWLSLAAIPSGLLLAVTNFVTTDLIAAPLLWVVPLAIYLVSFIVAFSPRGRELVRAAESLAPAVVMLLFVPYGSAHGWPVLPLLGLEFGGLAIIATALHGRLAAARPEQSRLTEYYLLLSAGGVIGGAFVALLAPVVFAGIWEYPILAALAMTILVLDPLASSSLVPTGAVRRLAPYVAIGGILLAALATARSPALEASITWLMVGAVALVVGSRPTLLAAITVIIVVLAVAVVPEPALFRGRGFFGVVEVSVAPNGQWIRLRNGTTIHGFQLTDPARRLEPTAYYDPAGPVGDLFAVLEEARAAASDPGGRAVGVVGLGTGTIATYMDPGDSMTFYEIDPLVVRVASEQFTFLAGAPSRPEVVVADGRLALEDVPTATFHMLVLDAFSSDAIPVHLLTVEALQEALRVVRPGGLVAYHLSNLYYDLVPAVAAGAEQLGLRARARSFRPTERQVEGGAVPSDWLVVAGNPTALSGFGARGWLPAIGGPEVPTDDHANLLRYIDLGLP